LTATTLFQRSPGPRASVPRDDGKCQIAANGALGEAIEEKTEEKTEVIEKLLFVPLANIGPVPFSVPNWFRAEGVISAGIVEGLNNKAKLPMRKAYGFRTEKAIAIAIYHQLGDLPEPEFTHRFC
jgi:hypothetical protein